MFTVGKVSPIAQRLIDVTHASMMAGIEAVKPGATLGDVGYACQQVAENAGYSVVQDSADTASAAVSTKRRKWSTTAAKVRASF